jgi:DNA mismatch repair protein MutS
MSAPSWSGSVLFSRPADAGRPPEDGSERVAADLNLDQIVAAATVGREEYELAGFYGLPLRDPDDVRYRQEVVRDLERPPVRAAVDAFTGDMRSMRWQRRQEAKVSHPLQKASWFLDATRTYVDGVERLARALAAAAVESRGLRGLRDALSGYLASTPYRTFAEETRRLRDDIAGITYAVFVVKHRVTVKAYDGETDYSAEVEATFRRFQQAEGKDYRTPFRDRSPDMNHVEEQVLERVARLFPEVFERLSRHRERRRDFLDPTVARFDREVQFCLGFLDLVGTLEKAGLAFCFPDVTDASDAFFANDTFDLALAQKLVAQRGDVVRNDVALRDPERVIVVSGPNQGGKTTFARTFGQLHWLARLGLPVPGRSARLLLADHLFTHFETEEHFADLRGKLQDELVRLRAILSAATDRSVIVINESFTTTTANDARFLGREVLGRIIARGARCVYVTFLDELSTLGPATVSMVSTVAPDDPTVRTFRVVRRAADGRAYALAIAAKYGLTAESRRKGAA